MPRKKITKIVYWPSNWQDYELIAHIKTSALASQMFNDVVKIKITIEELPIASRKPRKGK